MAISQLDGQVAQTIDRGILQVKREEIQPRITRCRLEPQPKLEQKETKGTKEFWGRCFGYTV